MIDANLLRYAVNEDVSHGATGKGWLDGKLAGIETAGFSWIIFLAFLCLATNRSCFPGR